MRIVVGDLHGLLEAVESLVVFLEVHVAVAFERFARCSDNRLARGVFFQIFESLLVVALLVEECSSLEVCEVRTVVAFIGSHLLVFGECDGVVAHKQLDVGLTDGVVGGVLAGFADYVYVDEDYCDDGGYCEAAPYYYFGVILNFLFQTGEGFVYLVDRILSVRILGLVVCHFYVSGYWLRYNCISRRAFYEVQI